MKFLRLTPILAAAIALAAVCVHDACADTPAVPQLGSQSPTRWWWSGGPLSSGRCGEPCKPDSSAGTRLLIPCSDAAKTLHALSLSGGTMRRNGIAGEILAFDFLATALPAGS